MEDFDQFLDILVEKLKNIAKGLAKDIKDAFIQDGVSFAETAKNRLQRWTKLVEEGRLTMDEFKYLLEAEKDLAKMEALKEKGLAKIRIDKLRHSLINAVIESVIAVL